MIEYKNTLLSEEIFEEQFVCNIAACKGACCVEGDAGAPLEENEINQLENNLDAVTPYLTEKGKETLQKTGAFVVDTDGEYVTPLNNGKECAYTIFDEDGTAKCGIEKAWEEGESSFQKPISCHLYPIRTVKVGNYDALNYHRWEICNAACDLGVSLKTPIYKFLKKPLVKKYGEDWYKELAGIHEALKEHKKK